MARGRAPRTNWQEIPKRNAEWENYYRTQGLPSADEGEFQKFKDACARELPVTFRITGISNHAIEVREMMESTYINNLKNQTWEGQPVEAPKPLPFYPDRLAWQVNVGKQVIRRNAQFSEFQRFLVVETNAGHVSRQELVSMIPPLMLEVEPHHTVLDTCASPGSKTVQLIEALHQKPNPTGVVIANDSDYKRSHMLTHQIKRLNSPNIIVTNHDAQMYPKIWLGDEYLRFDRILCDVPCSGDATMRKNINVWRDWKVGNGLGLHNLQLNIATRSVHLLKVGGRLVYSTCSLNPIEDEAVVAQLLRQFPNLHLVDMSSKLPELKRSPGTSNWKVQDKTKKEWHDLDDMGALPRSWFRPTEEEAAKFNLDRTVRVYPEQQNSGGFFIAVLELSGRPVEVKDLEAAEEAQAAKDATAKDATDTTIKDVTANDSTQEAPKDAAEDTAPTPCGPEQSERQSEEEEKISSEPPAKRVKLDKPPKEPKLPRDVPSSEEPFKFLRPDHPDVLSCVKFYGLTDDFKRDSLVVRNATGEPSRSIYFVAPSMKPIFEHNENKVKFIHGGIKLFNAQRNDGDCKWRVQIEGIEMIKPYVTKRLVTTSNKETLRSLCLESFIRIEQFKESDPELYAQVADLDEGCCIWDLDGAIYPLWRGRANLNLMAPKEITAELLLRFFGVDKKTLDAMKKPDQDPKEEKKDESEQKSVE